MIDELEDDGLPVAEVGPWAELKYQRLEFYCEILATSMKGKWEQRVYIDLFSGPGRARVRDTSRVLASSPTIALQVRNPFDGTSSSRRNGGA